MEDLHKDIQKGAEQDLGKRDNLRKVLTILGALILLIIFTSYFTFGPYGLRIVEGLSETNTINEQQLTAEKQGITVELSKETYLKLKEMFIQNEGQEFKACLLGEKTENYYYLDEVFVPEIFEQTFQSVRSAGCPEGSLVDLHSHPLNSCIPSFHDIQNLNRIKERDKDVVMAVMCNTERFNIYP